MTHPAVEWTLDQVADVVDSVATDYSLDGGAPVQVRRVDRDESRLYDGSGTLDMSTPIRERKSALEKGVYIGATYADHAGEPIGTEFDLDVETVVGLRLEGLTARGGEWGHVDPDGEVGVPWTEFVDRVQTALYDGRTYPDAGGAGVSFTHLLLTNEAPQSSNYADYYRYDVDVAFNGFETLP